MTNGIFGQSTHGFLFSLDEWILIGCIIHLSYMSLTWIFQIGADAISERESDNLLCQQHGDEATPCGWIYWICGGCMWLFFFAWMVIGFVLWQEMNVDSPENTQCKSVLLAWNIIRVIECTLTPCIGFCYTWCMTIQSYIDD
eukprot:177628_1